MSDKPGKLSLWLRIVVVLVALAAVAFGVKSYLLPTAKVEAVISGDAVDAKPGSIVVNEEYSMQMKSGVRGRVLSKDFHLDTGMHVKEGDILVQLDTGGIDIEIEQAKNEFETSKQKVAVGSAMKYALESAESDFNNIERLFKMGQVAESDYLKSRRAVSTIKQQQAMEVVLNDANLKTDENNLKSKLYQREKMTIRAPFAGEVSAVLAHPGDLIDEGSPIVSLITTTRIVEAKISEEDFANVRKGQKATVIFLPYGDWNYNGTVKKILPTADPETQRHMVDLDITDIEPAKLIPGITGEVTIEVGRRQANAIIPRRALINENVYVVKNGRVELRQVKKGYVWLTGAEILQGLEPGEQVIVEDLDSFRDGDSVRVQELPSDAIPKRK
jgi:RND family efflux transporter MFP subunit